MKDNKNVKRLAEPDTGIYLLFMILFVAGAIFFKMYYLAAAEGAVVMVLFSRRLSRSIRRLSSEVARFLGNIHLIHSFTIKRSQTGTHPGPEK